MATTTTTERRIVTAPPRNLETIAWRWMRISGFLLIPLVWIHTLLQDILVGVHAIDLNYVAFRWASLGWRVFDALLLGFAFAHGMYGVKQVAYEYIHNPSRRRVVAWIILIAWLLITLTGAIAIVGGVSQDFPLE
ncbi:MAG TPA: hypothetical protein VFF68_12305 [Anaerolineaceae bacterium]|nr:hypothetical protein [Anaerolineaceae bacterium]